MSSFIFPPIRDTFLEKCLWLSQTKNSGRTFETDYQFSFSDYHYFFVVKIFVRRFVIETRVLSVAL